MRVRRRAGAWRSARLAPGHTVDGASRLHGCAAPVQGISVGRMNSPATFSSVSKAIRAFISPAS